MKRVRPTSRRGAAALLLVVATIASVLCAPSPAEAATAATPGPPGLAFYTPPSTPPTGVHGDLVSYRTTTVSLGTGAPAVNAWNVLYQSTDSNGKANYVTGTVLVPTAAYTGTRPVISYAVGTHGLAQRCAPSLQLAAGTDYERDNIVAALGKGYAVLISDYAGYTTGSTPTYTVGRSEGNAVLDIVRAAAQVPNTGISASAPVGLWGYSQGGQAAGWAGQLQPTYAPSVPLKGVAAGGVPADLRRTSAYLDGGTGAAFVFESIIGLATEYPNLPIDAILNDAGKAAFAKLKTQCVFEALLEQQNKKVSDYTVGGLTLEQLLGIPFVATAVDAQKVGGTKVNVPVYAFHGRADEIVPLDQGYQLKRDWCAAGTNVTWDLYPSEHITTQFQSATKSLQFLAARFAGTAATGNCAQATAPTSTAPPKGGPFEVTLDKWNLGGELNLTTLASKVILPAGGSFNAKANLTTRQLTGDLSVPDFDTPVNFLGILPLTAKVGLLPAGTTGTVELDANGQLHIAGTARAKIVIKQLSFLGIPLTTAQCTTNDAVAFPLSYDGPVSALGSTGLRFTGTATIGAASGCENDFIGSIGQLLLPGLNNAFTYIVTPPAPVPA